ncbi:AsmA family protein [Pedobacter steynii]
MTINRKMPRWSKITLKVIGILIGLILIIFSGLALYVNSNKESLLQTITQKLNKNLNGTLTIGSMEPTFLRGFPGVSIKLLKVTMRDSLWKNHQHTLLDAKELEVSVNTLSLLKGTVEIKKIGINNAAIYLFTDSNGYSNTAIFRKKDKTKRKMIANHHHLKYENSH